MHNLVEVGVGVGGGGRSGYQPAGGLPGSQRSGDPELLAHTATALLIHVSIETSGRIYWWRPQPLKAFISLLRTENLQNGFQP